MKIKHTVQDKTLDFEDIEIGDVFKLDNDNNTYYIKIAEACDDTGGVIANAVILSNGDIDYIASTEPVIPINAELCVDD